jgi:aromatic ring hydroxylase
VKSTCMPCGTQVPDVVYCNVARKHAGESIYHEYNILSDLAGGLPATLPYDSEFMSEEVGDLVKKYLVRADGVSPEDIYKCFAWVSDYTCSSLAGVYQYAAVHGGGSPVMEDIALLGTYDLEERKTLAKRLAGIDKTGFAEKLNHYRTLDQPAEGEEAAPAVASAKPQ